MRIQNLIFPITPDVVFRNDRKTLKIKGDNVVLCKKNGKT